MIIEKQQSKSTKFICLPRDHNNNSWSVHQNLMIISKTDETLRIYYPSKVIPKKYIILLVCSALLVKSLLYRYMLWREFAWAVMLITQLPDKWKVMTLRQIGKEVNDHAIKKISRSRRDGSILVVGGGKFNGK